MRFHASIGSQVESTQSIEQPLQSYISPLSATSLLSSSAFLGTGLLTDDIELFHHYHKITAFSLAADSYKQYVWRHSIPELAKTSAYLRHNLLALSAIHNARLRPYGQQRYQRLASYHQCHAATEFRNAVHKISADNVHAVCAAAGITILAEMGRPLPLGLKPSPDFDPIANVLDKFLLIRKTVQLWRSSLPYLIDRMNPPFRSSRKQFVPPEKQSREFMTALEDLETLNKTTVPAEEQGYYAHAIKLLSWEFSTMVLLPSDFEQTLRWGSAIDEEYIKLLRLGRPMALVILAHYCVLLYHDTKSWCLVGWAETVFRAIKGALNEPWTHCLIWAEDAMNVDRVRKSVEIWPVTKDHAVADVVCQRATDETLSAKTDTLVQQRIERLDGDVVYPYWINLSNMTGIPT